MILAPRLQSQERGAIALGEAVLGLGVNTRVLMIGAHPDDEDTNLITWLSRGRHVSTAYLSLTRGDGGQNVIGNELGEALGVLRTEELLAARRIDGAQQFFTRAYDFGFSKDTVDTYAHWPKDTLLGDVVRVVRAFRPHVIVAVFSGTTRDGHGQHQVSGLLAREAYELSGDAARYPVQGFGPAWAPLKFYRAARGNEQAGTLGVDVGEYSPLRGESYGEIAGRSRSQHKSQGFGALERKGPIMNYVRREATRVNESMPATSERSMFDGIDTTWNRFASIAGSRRAVIDSLPSALTRVRNSFDPYAPWKLIASLSEAANWISRVCPPIASDACSEGAISRVGMLEMDLRTSARETQLRIWGATRIASGISIEATTPREMIPVGVRFPVHAVVYNDGPDSLLISNAVLAGSREGISRRRVLPPGQIIRDTLYGVVDSVVQPSWLNRGRDANGGMFIAVPGTIPENIRLAPPVVYYLAGVGGNGTANITFFDRRVIYRFADDVLGEVRRPAAVVPGISVTLDDATQYMAAKTSVSRTLDVRLRSAHTDARDVRVFISLPTGLSADSAAKQVHLGGYGAESTVSFRIRGQLSPGRHDITIRAVAGADTSVSGYRLIDYPHIEPQRMHVPARVDLRAVDVRVPRALRVAYIPGVSDNVASALEQLGIPVRVIAPAEVARTDLSPFTTVVVGPRAYEAHPALASANAKLFDFARRGGTLVVQYGQYEITQPGMMPYPITLNRPHDRVTHEEAPVTILDANAAVLRSPNRITQADFEGWVQERSLYMPRTFDERYRPVIGISDPGEPLNRGGILVAPLGRGTYVYTTLAFFRQLPAGVPGAARLFVNLLSAGLPASANP